MRRREFISFIGRAAIGSPFMARAEQPVMPVIGLLGAATESGWAPQVRAFHEGLRDGGYKEGRNVAIKARWADNQYDRLLSDWPQRPQKQTSQKRERMSAKGHWRA